MSNINLRVPSTRVGVLIANNSLLEAKRISTKFFGDRYFSQFIREAIERYVEYFKTFEDALSTKRVYCDIQEKVYYSLLEYAEDKEMHVGEVIAELLTEALFSKGVIEESYPIPEMNNLVF